MPEPAGQHDAVEFPERLGRGKVAVVIYNRSVWLHPFGFYPVDMNAYAAFCCSVLYGFGYRQVGIMQPHILAHDGDAHCLLGRLEPMQCPLPLFQIGVVCQPAVGQAETAADHIVQPFLVEHQRYFVDAAHIRCVCYGIHWHIAEIGNLGLQVGRKRAVAATDDGIGLNAVAAQDGHGMLRGLGFLLASGCYIGHESDMNEAHILTPHIQAQLADGF